MENIFTALIYVAVIAGVYFGLYYLNHKTPPPVGMEDLKADCEACHFHDCGNHPSHNNYAKENLNHD